MYMNKKADHEITILNKIDLKTRSRSAPLNESENYIIYSFLQYCKIEV